MIRNNGVRSWHPREPYVLRIPPAGETGPANLVACEYIPICPHLTYTQFKWTTYHYLIPSKAQELFQNSWTRVLHSSNKHGLRVKGGPSFPTGGPDREPHLTVDDYVTAIKGSLCHLVHLERYIEKGFRGQTADTEDESLDCVSSK